MSAAEVDEEFQTTAEVAVRLRCSTKTLERYVKRGLASPMRIGRRMRWTEADVAQLKAARTPELPLTRKRRRRRT